MTDIPSPIFSGLPSQYNFEIDKTVRRIKQKNAKCVALQFPEGLLMFSTVLADILEEATGAEMVILGDVTYGACCVDDFAANALGCDFLVHYGHSCLISIKDCLFQNMMYVFVEIGIDVSHFVETVKAFIPSDRRTAFFATIQFISSMRTAAMILEEEYFTNPIIVPQIKPLSCGELLGCTSPIVNSQDVDLVVYLGDGRFHLESFLIANPNIESYQYNPYQKLLTKEGYDHEAMHQIRMDAIRKGKQAESFALIMGTLGRQGNPRVVDRIYELARRRGKNVTLFLMSEIFPSKLALLREIDCYIQVACPRLSIDWGYAFDKPLLSCYEAEVALGSSAYLDKYPMDHYSKSGGKWSVYGDKSFV